MTTNATVPIPELSPTEIDTFWKSIKVLGENDCWPWIGSPSGKGRPKKLSGIHHRASIRPGLSIIGSRLAYFLANKVDPGKFLVCHSCDNPPCCNPAHLFLGDHSVNAKDAVAKGIWSSKPPIHYGESNPAAKMTEVTVREMREIYENGDASHPFLARKYGISTSAAWHIVTRKTWKHVP